MSKKEVQIRSYEFEAQLRGEMTEEMIENRTVEFVISTEAVDSYGTVFKMDGWDLDAYRKNPIVMYNHRTWSGDLDDIIATSEVFVEGDQLIGRATFESAEDNPKAGKVFQKILNGTLRGASINASIQEAHWGVKEAGEDEDVLYFTKQALREWSVVPFNSNPDAVKRSKETIESFKNKENRNSAKRKLTWQEAEFMFNENNCY